MANGYHLIACDGSDVYFAANPQEQDCYFEQEGAQGYCLAHLNALQDVIGGTYLDAIVQDRRCENEVEAMIQMLERQNWDNKTIFTADRGYECYKLMAHIQERQKLIGENIVSSNTVKSYMDHLMDAFLFHECKRWDVKGRNYFDYPNKYYCEDVGLRNARIGFRQQELTHIMENIIYNDLIIRGCAVDIGIVYGNTKDSKGRTVQVAREIDFIATLGGK